MLVKDFMTSMIITAESTTTVVRAIKLMAAEEIGSLLVTTGDVLEGLVTERELLCAQLLSEEVYQTLTIGDIMATPVVTISPDADLGQVVSLMDQTGRKHIPVIEGNDVIGIVTSSDIIRVLATFKIIADGRPIEEED